MPDADGPSGVHVAMSNTLNTPIEALEREFPVRVLEYALRRDSGGAGVHRGGDGVVRELEALREMTYSLIAERRRHAPRGARGGEPGLPGHDSIDGRTIPGKSTGVLAPVSGFASKRPAGAVSARVPSRDRAPPTCRGAQKTSPFAGDLGFSPGFRVSF